MGITWDARTGQRSGGVYVSPPSWLSISCATAGRSSRQGPSSIASGLGSNAFRAWSVDGSTYGLLVERSATNLLSQDNPISWAASNVSLLAVTGPDGSNSACRISDVSPQTGYVYVHWSGATIGQPYTTSAWVANGSRTSGVSTQATIASNATNNTVSPAYPFSSWSRVDSQSNAFQASTNAAIIPFFSAATDTGSFEISNVQFESGKYPTSEIRSNGTPGTRDADILSVPGSLFTTRGAFRGRIIVAPLYGSSEQGNDHDLWYASPTARIYIQQSSGKVRFRVGGTTIESAALAWGRGDSLSVEFASSPKLGMRLSVNGGATVVGSYQGPIATPSAVYLLGDGTGTGQECAALRSITAFRPFS